MQSCVHCSSFGVYVSRNTRQQSANSNVNIFLEHNKTGLQVQPISRLDKMHIFHFFRGCYAQALGQRTMHNIGIIDDSLVTTFKLFHWFAIPRNPTMQFGILAMGSPAPRSSYILKSGQTIISSTSISLMHNTQCNNLELVCDLNILGLMFHPSKCPTFFSYRLHFRDSAICVTSFHVLPQLGGGQLFLGHPTHPTSTQCQPISYVYNSQYVYYTKCMYKCILY